MMVGPAVATMLWSMTPSMRASRAPPIMRYAALFLGRSVRGISSWGLAVFSLSSSPRRGF